MPSDESVRLTIDGSDVTHDAELGDGQLPYDAQQAPTVIELGRVHDLALRVGDLRGRGRAVSSSLLLGVDP